MKLEDWYRNKGWLVQDPTDLEENKHVISTCEFCGHWKKGGGQFKPTGTDKWLSTGSCEKLDSIQPPNQRFGSSPHETFGCLYWSEKND